jgi:hypothetical protein
LSAQPGSVSGNMKVVSGTAAEAEAEQLQQTIYKYHACSITTVENCFL